jgi:excisionase family DNA binding protein
MSRQPTKPPSRNQRNPDPYMMSTRQAADYLGVTRTTIQNWARDGKLTVYRIGDKPLVKFKRDELDSFIDSQISTSA